MENQSNSSHHVAWADRIKTGEQWVEDRKACSNAHGTDLYHHMLRRFINNIPNVKNGPKLHDMIENKKIELFTIEFDKLLMNWANNFPQLAENDSEVLLKKDQISSKLDELLYYYIIQLLEDHGFGFYKTDEGDYEEMK